MPDKTRRELFEAERARKAALPLRVMRVRWSRSKYWPRKDTPKSERIGSVFRESH